MSKTQDKKAQRLAESAAFVHKRRQDTLEFFEHQFAAGLALFENNKDKLSEEEVTLLEAEIENNKSAIEDYKKQWNL
jgi:hypothetical protein